jgi:hypothetical protein
MPAMAKLRDIPGAVEAVRRVMDCRDAAFLDFQTMIHGRPVLPLTIRHWIILDAIDDPFLAGRIPQPEEVVRFLWAMNPRFAPGRSFRRWRFINSCKKLPYEPVVLKIRQFVADSFQDRPPSSSGERRLPQMAFAASLVHSIANSYHWPEAAILGLPLGRAFQYLKAIRMSANPELPKWNPWDGLLARGYRELKAREKQRPSCPPESGGAN